MEVQNMLTVKQKIMFIKNIREHCKNPDVSRVTKTQPKNYLQNNNLIFCGE